MLEYWGTRTRIDFRCTSARSYPNQTVTTLTNCKHEGEGRTVRTVARPLVFEKQGEQVYCCSSSCQAGSKHRGELKGRDSLVCVVNEKQEFESLPAHTLALENTVEGRRKDSKLICVRRKCYGLPFQFVLKHKFPDQACISYIV